MVRTNSYQGDESFPSLIRVRTRTQGVNVFSSKQEFLTSLAMLNFRLSPLLQIVVLFDKSVTNRNIFFRSDMDSTVALHNEVQAIIYTLLCVLHLYIVCGSLPYLFKAKGLR